MKTLERAFSFLCKSTFFIPLNKKLKAWVEDIEGLVLVFLHEKIQALVTLQVKLWGGGVLSLENTDWTKSV